MPAAPHQLQAPVSCIADSGSSIKMWGQGGSRLPSRRATKAGLTARPQKAFKTHSRYDSKLGYVHYFRIVFVTFVKILCTSRQ